MLTKTAHEVKQSLSARWGIPVELVNMRKLIDEKHLTRSFAIADIIAKKRNLDIAIASDFNERHDLIGSVKQHVAKRVLCND